MSKKRLLNVQTLIWRLGLFVRSCVSTGAAYKIWNNNESKFNTHLMKTRLIKLALLTVQIKIEPAIDASLKT